MRYGYGYGYGITGGRVQTLDPSQVTSGDLKFWYRSEKLQLSAQPLAAGTTPPNITLSGTLTAADQIHISVHTVGTGAPGNTTVDVALNGTTVLTAQSTAAATVAIPGSTVTITFPASGTYAANNTWDSTVAQWTDKSANGFTLLQATAANEPLMIHDSTATLGPDGAPWPTIRTDGVNDRFQRNDTGGDFAHSVFGGADAPFEVWSVVYAPNAITAGHVIWHAGSTSDANLPMVQLALSNTNGLQVRRRATAGNDKILHSAFVIKPGQHFVRWVFDGTTSTVYDNGIVLIGPGSGVDGTQTLGASITLNTFSVAAQVTTSTSNFLGADFYELFGYGGARPNLSAADAGALLAYIS